MCCSKTANRKRRLIKHLANHPHAGAHSPTVTFCTENKGTLTTGEELIEGEWAPNQFLGVLEERELVLNLEPAVAMAVSPRSLSGKRSASKNKVSI